MKANVKIDPSKLRQAREKAGLSQSQAAKALDIARQVIWRLEAGKVGLNGDFLASLCLLYDVQITDLISEKEKETVAA